MKFLTNLLSILFIFLLVLNVTRYINGYSELSFHSLLNNLSYFKFDFEDFLVSLNEISILLNNLFSSDYVANITIYDWLYNLFIQLPASTFVAIANLFACVFESLHSLLEIVLAWLGYDIAPTPQ